MKISVVCYLLFLFFHPFQAYAEGKIVINEFLPHPSSGNKEWVEFYNSEQVDLSSYWFDDDPYFNESKETGSDKKLLSEALLNTDNPEYPFIELSPFLNNDKDYVVLFGSKGLLLD